MRKYIGLIPLVLLLLIGSCKNEAPPSPPNAMAEMAADSVELDKITVGATFASTDPRKLKSKWVYKKKYRICWNIAAKPGERVQIVFHKKNLAELFYIEAGTSGGSHEHVMREFFWYQPYVTIRIVDEVTGDVIETPLIEDNDVNVCGGRTSSERDNIKTSSTSGSTVAVTVDE